MQEAFAVVRSKLREAAVKSAAYYDKDSTPVRFRVGDTCYLKQTVFPRGLGKKFRKRFTGPYRITELLTPVTFRLKSIYGRAKCVAHCNRMKPASCLEDILRPLGEILEEEIAADEGPDPELAEDPLSSDPNLKEISESGDSELLSIMTPRL